MDAIRITGQIIKKCEPIGYTVIANGKKKLSRQKVLELIEKGKIVGGMVVTGLNNEKYIDILPEVEKAISISNTKHTITERVTKNNEVIGYRIDNISEIVSPNDVWGLCFNGEITNAVAKLSCKDGSNSIEGARKLICILDDVRTESL